MFESIKVYFQNVKGAWDSLYAWEDKTIIVPEDTWGFYAHTGAYVWDGKPIAAKNDHIGGSTDDGTWINVVEQILDVLGEHYGYDIKSQVYYAVEVPTNDIFNGEAQGRKLNDGVLQQLLLAFPEVYERNENFGEAKDIFAK